MRDERPMQYLYGKRAHHTAEKETFLKALFELFFVLAAFEKLLPLRNACTGCTRNECKKGNQSSGFTMR